MCCSDITNMSSGLWQVWGAKDDVFEFAHVPGGTDMLGRLRFAYNDFSI